MFVFRFVGDSLAATTTEPLLGAVQPLEMLSPGKTEEAVQQGSSGRGKWPLYFRV